MDKSLYTCGAPVSTAVFPTSDSPATTDNLGNYMTDDVAKMTSWCDADGNSFFLLNAYYNPPCAPNWRSCDGAPSGASTFPFQALDGGDVKTLTGNASDWGGITIGDIIQSSYSGFLLNDNKNGYVSAHFED